MYKNFFGFIEKPFKLVPNPDYLYMSKNHDSALAQLTYATDQGDGFVLITGEVGTGKTTLIRMFLERLGERAESAYIFNTLMDSAQLLESICSEFRINTSGYTAFKGLVDLFNAYLIGVTQLNRKVILVIDEAQNLTVENLEMIRMLSNLETTRNKLLQIVLVGQPELATKLEAYELRQLSQRISLCAQLTALSVKETQAFIEHRVNIGAQRRLEIFTTGACRRIHGYAGGIPRLINIAADRALLVAYELKKPKVTTAVAKSAIHALTHSGPLRAPQKNWALSKSLWAIAVAIICIGLILLQSGWVDHFIQDRKPIISGKAISLDQPQVPTPVESQQNFKIENTPLSTPNQSLSTQAIAQGTSLAASVYQAASTTPNGNALSTLVDTLEPQMSRLNALTMLLSLWQQPSPNPAQLPSMVDDFTFFQIAALQYSLQLLIVKQDWNLIQRLNLPAIIALAPTGQTEAAFLTLVGRHDGRWRVSNGNSAQDVEIEPSQLQPLAPGSVYIFWNNLLGPDSVISHSSPVEVVSELKRLLRLAGYSLVSPGPGFDLNTHRAVIDFQIKNQIAPDGLVGPVTKILLMNQAGVGPFPRLDPSAGVQP